MSNIIDKHSVKNVLDVLEKSTNFFNQIVITDAKQIRVPLLWIFFFIIYFSYLFYHLFL